MLLQWCVMPMGLKNSPMTFQRIIDRTLEGIKGRFAYGYIDDIIIFSNNFEEHMMHLEEVFKRLMEAGLRINKDKCEFCMTSVK